MYRGGNWAYIRSWPTTSVQFSSVFYFFDHYIQSSVQSLYSKFSSVHDCHTGWYGVTSATAPGLYYQQYYHYYIQVHRGGNWANIRSWPTTSTQGGIAEIQVKHSTRILAQWGQASQLKPRRQQDAPFPGGCLQRYGRTAALVFWAEVLMIIHKHPVLANGACARAAAAAAAMVIRAKVVEQVVCWDARCGLGDTTVEAETVVPMPIAAGPSLRQPAALRIGFLSGAHAVVVSAMGCCSN